MKAVFFIVALQVFVAIATIAAIIYLIIRRYRVRKHEKFEKRDN
jgi:hypothetical protein